MKKKGDKDKVVEYIPVISDLQVQNWWQYRHFSKEEIQKIEEFFNTYAKDLPNSMTTNIYDNFKFVANALGLQLHPVFQQIPEYFEKEWKEQDSQISIEPPAAQQDAGIKKPAPTLLNPKKKAEGEQQSNTHEINFLIFHGITIDYGTARVLQYALQFSQIGTLKFLKQKNIKFFRFHHNNFDKETLEILKLKNLYLNETQLQLTLIQNSIKNCKNQIFLQQLQRASLANLQFLVLRCNQINNQNIKQFCEALKAFEATQLKCLDLFDNLISKEGVDAIGEMLSTNKSLEYLCLGKNQLKTNVTIKFLISLNKSDIESLVNNIGKQFLSQQELIDFREQEKRISQIIETNKKIKKKELQEHVPYLEPVQEQDGGFNNFIKNINFKKVFFHLRNSKLSLLNLSMNNLNEQCKEFIERLLKGASETFQLILNFNQFDDKTRENLKKNYKKQIFI